MLEGSNRLRSTGDTKLSTTDTADLKALALKLAENSLGSCVWEVPDGDFHVKRPSRKWNLDPLFLKGGSIFALIGTMTLATDFIPLALVALCISFLMPNASRFLAVKIQQRLMKPLMLDPSKVSIHSCEMRERVQKAQQFGLVATYLLMPDDSLQIVLKLPDNTLKMLEMLE